jgi:methanethiol S-methyltransferase
MFKRVTVFTYGVVSYLVFFASFLYAIGFIGNILVPKSIDSAPTVPSGPRC